MALKLSEKQKMLESQDVRVRLEQVMTLIEGEMEVLQIEKKIRGPTPRKIVATRAWWSGRPSRGAAAGSARLRNVVITPPRPWARADSSRLQQNG